MCLHSRERILRAFSHTGMSQVPVDFGGHRSSGIDASAYHRLRTCLGLPQRPIRVYDVVQQLAIVDDDVLDRFGIDTIELGRGFTLDDSWWVDWILPDGISCRVPAWALPEHDDDAWVLKSPSTGRVLARMTDGTNYFEQVWWPYADGIVDLGGMPENWSDCLMTGIATPPGPEIETLDGFQVFSDGARALREKTDRAILGLFGGSLFEFGQAMYRPDRFLMLLADEPSTAHAFLDRVTELHLNHLERYLETVGDFIDIIVFNDDLGMQTGPQLSPAMYREFFKERHTALWGRAQQYGDLKVMLHSCGGIRELLHDIIETGVDAVNPVQTTCRGMDLVALKQEYGREIVFWGGGCNTETLTGDTSTDDVYDHVRAQIEIGMEDGGYVFQPIHALLRETPPSHITAMFDTVKILNQSE